jgi:signal transduction histidine kinase
MMGSWSLRTKIVSYVAGFLLVFLGVSLSWRFYHERRAAYETMETRAIALADEMGYAFEALAKHQDSFSLQRIVEQTGTIGDVEEVGIADREGRYFAHNVQTMVGSEVDPSILQQVLEVERRRVTYGSHDFVVAQPLRGERYLPEYRSDVVGVITVTMNMEPTNAKLRGELLAISSITVVFVLVLTTSLLVMLDRIVLSPVRALLDGTRELAAGDLRTEVAPQGADELGDLAQSFNAMAHDLRMGAEEREALQAALLRKERLAAVGQVTATVGHELRNPLGTLRNTVVVISKTLRDGLVVSEQLIDRAERSVDRCARIVDELLDFTRARPLRKRALELDRWLDAELAGYEFPDSIELERRVGCNAVVEFDDELMRRLVINAVKNACDAMLGEARESDSVRRAGGVLTVSTARADGRVAMTFEDTGPGLDANELGSVFEPLYSTKSFGVGLGLPLVKRIAEQHGGGVIMSSSCGHGAVLEVWLPLEGSGDGSATQAAG